MEPFSQSDFSEQDSVDTFRKLIAGTHRILHDIKTQDRTRHYDGILRIAAKGGTESGQLFVQIKTINAKTNCIICPTDLLMFAMYQASMPVIIIGVDSLSNCAYWKNLDRSYCNALLQRGNISGYSILNSSMQKLSDNELTYVDEWEKIVKNHIQATQLSPAIQSFSTGETKPEFTQMQKFLDKLNWLYDVPFKSLKCEGVWKQGLAYSAYEPNQLSYSLFPITYGTNEKLIKPLEKATPQRRFIGNNPIEQNPERYAIEYVEKFVKWIVKDKLIHFENLILIKEYLFAFVDRFYIQLGLEKKDEYTVQELDIAFHYYLQFWVDEALKEKVLPSRSGFIDPDFILSQLSDEKVDQIKNRIIKRISEPTENIPLFPMHNSNFPMNLIAMFILNLRVKGIEKIQRTYDKKDYTRLEKFSSNLIWNTYSKEVIEKNIRILFNNAPEAFSDTVSSNFPEMKEELSYFKDYNVLLVSLELRDFYSTSDKPPVINIYRLKDKGSKENNTIIILKGQKQVEETNTKNEWKLKLNGKEYEIVSMRSQIFDFIYGNYPLMDYTIELLGERIDEYFKKLKSKADI